MTGGQPQSDRLSKKRGLRYRFATVLTGFTFRYCISSDRMIKKQAMKISGSKGQDETTRTQNERTKNAPVGGMKETTLI